MSVTIPDSIKREIRRVNEGIPFVKKSPPLIPDKELLPRALRNLDFLNEIANTEPILSLLLDEMRALLIITNFSPSFPDLGGGGDLCLTTKKGKTALFYWQDADYPANRSDNDYELVTVDEMKDWDKRSLKHFAELKEKEIWRMIEQTLQNYP